MPINWKKLNQQLFILRLSYHCTAFTLTQYERSAGVVKWFNAKLGFGFIISEEESSKIFVHKSAIVTKQKWRSLRKSQTVEFTIIETERGLQAERVTGPNGVPIKQPRHKKRQERPSKPTHIQNPSHRQPSLEKNQESECVQKIQDHETDSELETEEPQANSYFEQLVPDKYMSARNDDILHPTEWVCLRRNKKIAQVAYPIISLVQFENFETIPWKSLKYKVFVKEGDYEGEDFSREELMKFEVIVPESTHATAGNNAFEGIRAGTWVAAGGKSSNKKLPPPPTPDRDNGEKWMKQAELDNNILKHLYKDCKEPARWGTICFMAQQVAEKVLKGGLLYFSSDQIKNFRRHSLNQFAKALSFKLAINEPKKGNDYRELPQLAQKLMGYYSKTRYPDSWSPPVVPADKYGAEHAEVAFESAEAIFDLVVEAMK